MLGAHRFVKLHRRPLSVLPAPCNCAQVIDQEPVPPLASCRAETLASDVDGINPDEVLGFALNP